MAPKKQQYLSSPAPKQDDPQDNGGTVFGETSEYNGTKDVKSVGKQPKMLVRHLSAKNETNETREQEVYEDAIEENRFPFRRPSRRWEYKIDGSNGTSLSRRSRESWRENDFCWTDREPAIDGEREQSNAQQRNRRSWRPGSLVSLFIALSGVFPPSPRGTIPVLLSHSPLQKYIGSYFRHFWHRLRHPLLLGDSASAILEAATFSFEIERPAATRGL